METMPRLLAAVLITCYLTALLNAQASKEEGPAGQTVAAPAAKTQFPLDAFPEFSAVMVGSVMPSDDRESYIYRSGKLLRNSGPEGHNFVITDLTTKETYGVSAPGCIHDRRPYFRAMPFSFAGPDLTVQRTTSGQETVDGYRCKIEDVTLSAKRFMNPIKLRLWEAEDLQGFPVKVVFLRGIQRSPEIHYKNVVLGPQDPTLFIYPKTCEKSLGYNAKGAGVTPGAKKPTDAPPAPPN